MTAATKLLSASGGVAGGTQSYSSPGTYYWLCPPGITKVDVTGQGGSNKLNVTYYWSTSTPYMYVTQGSYTFYSNPPFPNMGAYTFQQVAADANSLLSQWQNVTTSSNGAFYSMPFYEYFQASNGNIHRRQNTYSYTYRRTGTVSMTGSVFSRSGNVGGTNYTCDSGITGGIQVRVPSYNWSWGTSSTAFGHTFANGSGSSSHTGTSVSPGTTYTIVVGTNQDSAVSFVNFDYYG